MPSYTITPVNATEVKLTIDSEELVFKKCYCYTAVSGDNLLFFAHQAELNSFRQQYSIPYTDCTVPSAASATALKTDVDAIIGAYGIMDLYYLSYVDLTEQRNDDTVNYLRYNTKDFEYGITIRNDDEITFGRDGVYDIQFSAQIEKTDSGIDDIEIWLERNSNLVDNSSTIVTLSGNNAKAVAAWNWFVNALAGDVYKIAWYSADGNVQISHRAAASTPNRPAVPSVILTIDQISNGNV